MAKDGWRARVGVIKATYRPKNFRYWYDTAPDGVEIVPASLGSRKGEKRGFLDSFARGEELAHALKEAGCDLVIVHGAPPFILQGRDWEAEWRQKVQADLGIPFLTAMQPHAWALKALGVKRLLAHTYYNDELNDGIVRYFAEEGMETVLAGGLRAAEHDEELYSTPLKALDDVDAGDFYRYARNAYARLGGDGASVDCLYVNGSGWDAGPAVEPLEADVGRPVLWPQAMYVWAVYRTLGIDGRRSGFGSLLEDWPELPGD